MSGIAVGEPPVRVRRDFMDGFGLGLGTSRHGGPGGGREPLVRGCAGGCDGGDRVGGPVDLIERVVEVEAQAAAGQWGQAEGVVSQRGAVAAGARFHSVPVEGFSDVKGVSVGEIEGDK